MTKVAFISDIHSNLPALKAVLNDIRSRGISEIYCLGDIIGYHTFTNEVIDLIKSENIKSIKGNHDETIILENFDRQSEKDFVFYWNFDQLTVENLSFLKSLPDSINFKVEDITISIVHGSPKSITEYIREDSREADLYISEMDSDILLCGHTHLPYIMKKDGRYLLNTGSVGKPKFGKPEASYIELTLNSGVVEPQIITVPYPVKEITDHLKGHNFPANLIEALERGLP